MIKFTKIRWKNLLSTGNIFTEIRLDEHNTTLIIGENGAGKSTILDALSFVLFGKPFRKINKPQLMNSITQKGLVVEIEFYIYSNFYKIIRGMKPNIFEVYQNDVLLNQSADVKDYQEILEKQIIKVNHKSFCQVVVLGSATFQPFMQLSAGQRREIIEDLLDLQIFTRMNSLLKDKIIINNEALIRNSGDKKLVEEKIKLTLDHMKEIQNNNEQIKQEKMERIESVEKLIQSEKEKLNTLEEKIVPLKEQLVDEVKLAKQMKKMDQIRHELQAKLSYIQNDVKFFNDHDNCPTCNQLIQEEFKNTKIEEKNQLLEETQNGLNMLIEKQNELSKKIEEKNKVNILVANLEMEKHKVRTEINSSTNYKNQLIQEVNNIETKTVNVDNVKIEDLNKDLGNVKSKYINLMEDKNILSAALMMLKDGGIKSRIIKQYIPIINKLINKYLSSMEFMCQFELDENFNETIKSRYRDEFSYASFSEGEKMRINLAVLFAWRSIAKLRNSINTNLLIMDEVFDSSLDSNGTEEFIKLIYDLTSETNTFIISHKTDSIQDKFQNIIKFEKHKNFSRMV
ncbi:endonuclease subunit [uncultured Caudovirales phage]|uniref:Endonuclease subunit n=1 Tax=uncultured Caudovirales phage TaxID=2100421 RepID=A0A6J5NYW3_9CAUD|nr:endonuclease subunit [uncultured Caudovirales phage]